MEKSAQPGEGGDARPPPFTKSTVTYKVVVYAPAEKAGTHPPISALPLYVLCGEAGGREEREDGWMGDGDGEEEGRKEIGKGGSGEWRRDRES
jgi:hypothetical protein